MFSILDGVSDSKFANISRLYPNDGSSNASDLDPEAVRLALREFVQKYSLVKRDYEDAQAQITSLNSRLNEQAEQTEQWARRLHQLQQALCEAEAGNQELNKFFSNNYLSCYVLHLLCFAIEH